MDERKTSPNLFTAKTLTVLNASHGKYMNTQQEPKAHLVCPTKLSLPARSMEIEGEILTSPRMYYSRGH